MSDTAVPPGTADDEREVDALLERTRHRRGGRWGLVAVVAGLVVIVGWAFVAGRSLGRDPQVVRSPLLGKEAPALRLPALDGDEIDSAAYRGEVVVVNFWASWCVPCAEEAPQLEAFARSWAGLGVNLVGVVYDDAEDKADQFRERFGLTFPQALDPGGRTAIDFGVFGVPETYVVDARGAVMAKLIGAVDATTLDRIVADVQSGRTVSSRNDRYRTRRGS